MKTRANTTVIEGWGGGGVEGDFGVLRVGTASAVQGYGGIR